MNKFEIISQEQYYKDFTSENFVKHSELKLPHRATAKSAGYDIYSITDVALVPGETIKIPTGIKVQLDDDKFLAIVPRSSLGFKYRLQLDNTIGVIDADYYNNANNEGHIWIKVTNDGRVPMVVKKGEAIAQGIILQYFKAIDDDTTGERIGGFGSTNK